MTSGNPRSLSGVWVRGLALALGIGLLCLGGSFCYVAFRYPALFVQPRPFDWSGPAPGPGADHRAYGLAFQLPTAFQPGRASDAYTGFYDPAAGVDVILVPPVPADQFLRSQGKAWQPAEPDAPADDYQFFRRVYGARWDWSLLSVKVRIPRLNQGWEVREFARPEARGLCLVGEEEGEWIADCDTFPTGSERKCRLIVRGGEAAAGEATLRRLLAALRWEPAPGPAPPEGSPEAGV